MNNGKQIKLNTGQSHEQWNQTNNILKVPQKAAPKTHKETLSNGDNWVDNKIHT